MRSAETPGPWTETSAATVRPRAFRIYLACTLISFTGNLAYLAATTWLVLRMTGQAWSVPALFLLSAVPGVVFAPVAARIVERYDRRRLLIAIDAVAGVIVLLGPLAQSFGVLTTTQLFLQEFAISFGGTVFFTASRSFVREIVPKDGLLAANARLVGVYAVGNTLGALVGGLLVQYVSANTAMLFNAATFFVSVAGLLRIRARDRRPRDPAETAPGPAAPFRALAGRVLRSADLRPYVVLFLAVAGLQRLLLGLLQPFVVDDLRTGPLGFGIIQAALAVGAFSGSRVMPRMERAWGRRVTIGVLVVLIAPLVVAFALSPFTWLAAAVYFLLGALTQTLAISQTTVQEDDRVGGTDGSRLALLGMMQSLAVITTFALSTVLAAVVDIRTTYVVSAVLFAVVIAGPLVGLARGSRPPAPTTAT